MKPMNVNPAMMPLNFIDPLTYYYYPQDIIPCYFYTPTFFPSDSNVLSESIVQHNQFDFQTSLFKAQTNQNFMVVPPQEETSTKLIKNSSLNTKKNIKIIKPSKKCHQKQNRNVHSNIMRIFFKNIFQLKVYHQLIQHIINRLRFDLTPQLFYNWLASFTINYKCFVKHSQIIKICTKGGNICCQKILIMLIKYYLNGEAINHCLSSKRIKCASMKIHIQGIKNIKQSIDGVLCFQK